ncbi:MAG: DUF2183 domain-containing protein [Oscillochloris sp.]|nr:DUF2183 domain-containing protein [Oscillochloris sp.]
MIRQKLANGLFRAKRGYDRFTMHWKQRLGWLEPVIIEPYRSYGTRERLLVRGRVMEDREFGKVSANSSRWRNLLHIYRHFHTDEIPDARVCVRLADQECEAQCDGEGYFTLELTPKQPVDGDSLWQDIEVELIEPKAEGQGKVEATAQVFVPPADAEFGIISDIDDTVIITGANDFLRNLRANWMNNAETRRPFPGVDAFYTALQQGPAERGRNPIFYVSSSSWNIYPLFVDLLDRHDIPPGPLLLRNIGLDRQKILDTGHKNYKLDHIRPIFETYPELSFVLIGDSGQKDPEIYREVVHDYADRVKAIYIRDVTSPQRDKEIHAIADELAERGVPMVLADTSVTAAQHAVEHALITPAAMEKVRAEVERDQQRPEKREE